MGAIFPEEREFLENQVRLISKIESLLDELVTTTYSDNRYGRGFGSFYPEKSSILLQTMKFGINLELDYGKRRVLDGQEKD